MQDPFEIFDLPRQYAVDADVLRQRLVKLSAANHPDRFTDPLEQADAAERIAAINHAYEVLHDPAKRAAILLDLIQQGDSSSSASKANRDELPPDFLMEVMEIRETMEAAIEAGDQDKLDELGQWASTQRQANLNQIAVAFDAHQNSVTTDTTPDGLIQQVQCRLNVIRYLERMLEQMPD